MSSHHRSMAEVLGASLSRWHAARTAPAAGSRPVVAMSRLHGAGGGDVARRLGERLDLQVFDREILRQIAQSAHQTERVVAALDDRGRAVLSDWLAAFASPEQLTPYAYRQHLTRVISGIAKLGGAVILGRGAHLVLRPGEALRVLVVAPHPVRRQAVAVRDGVGLWEAGRRIASEESERRAFLKLHFNAEFADPASFDLVVNTAMLGVDGAVEAIAAALTRVPGVVAH